MTERRTSADTDRMLLYVVGQLRPRAAVVIVVDEGKAHMSAMSPHDDEKELARVVGLLRALADDVERTGLVSPSDPLH